MELKEFVINLKQQRKDIYDYLNRSSQVRYNNRHLNLEDMCKYNIKSLPIHIILEIINSINEEEIQYFGNDLLIELRHNEDFLISINNDYYFKNKDLRILTYKICDKQEFINTERNSLKRKELKKDLNYHKNSFGFYNENGKIYYIEKYDYWNLIFVHFSEIISSFITYYSLNELLNILNNYIKPKMEAINE